MSAERGRPAPDEYAAYYGRYIDLVPASDILAQLESQRGQFVAYLKSVPEPHSTRLHPPYTWTIRQVVGHLSDGERVFGYRALRVGRGDKTPLPGFDENEYARAPEFTKLTLAQLADEFDAVRKSTVLLFESFSPESWTRRGQANGHPVSVRALAYIMVGHVIHHMKIIEQRLASSRPPLATSPR